MKIVIQKNLLNNALINLVAFTEKKDASAVTSNILIIAKENVLNSINSFKKELDFCQNLIEDEKWQELTRWLYEARIIRDFL